MAAVTTPEDRDLDVLLAGFPEGDPALLAAAQLLGASPLMRLGRRPGPPGFTVPISSTRYLADLAGTPVTVRVVPLRRGTTSTDALSSARAFAAVLHQAPSAHVVGLRSEVHLLHGDLDAVCWAEEIVDGTDLDNDDAVEQSLAARSRSATGCGWTTPTTPKCGCRTRGGP